MTPSPEQIAELVRDLRTMSSDELGDSKILEAATAIESLLKEREEEMLRLKLVEHILDDDVVAVSPDLQICPTAQSAIRVMQERDNLTRSNLAMREALESIQEYWNGGEGSAIDAAEEMRHRAEQALSTTPSPDGWVKKEVADAYKQFADAWLSGSGSTSLHSLWHKIIKPKVTAMTKEKPAVDNPPGAS